MTDELVILYEDNHCLAVAKPAPLLTQGVPPGIPTLEALAKAHLWPAEVQPPATPAALITVRAGISNDSPLSASCARTPVIRPPFLMNPVTGT